MRGEDSGGALFLRFAVFFLLALTATSAARAQHQEIDALASNTAAAISRTYQRNFSPPKVLVVDFNMTNELPDTLGRKLASEFADSLGREAVNFSMVDRGAYLQAFAADEFTPQSYADAAAPKCYADYLKATVTVYGVMDLLPDKLVLWVRAIQIADNKQIFERRISMPLTPDLAQLIAEEAGGSGAPPALKVAWVNPNHPPVKDVVERDRSGDPTCVFCPAPSFTRAASEEKIQGTVLLQVQIADDGIPTQITVLKGLPCGLNQSAIDIVTRWRFTPAKGRNGEPVALTTSIEITFRLL
jgi:TonB family protein